MRKMASFVYARHRKYICSSALAATISLLAGNAAWAASPEDNGPVRLLKTIPVPVAPTNKTGGMYAFDISFVDQKTQTYYLGDRSNAVVDVVNASTGVFKTQFKAKPAFSGASPLGNNFSGPNGVVTTGKCVVATDAPSRVVSFTLAGLQVSDVRTSKTSKFRADELAFDPKDGLLLVANNADTPPFATLIKIDAACKMTVGKQIPFPFSTNGAEQPAWEPATQRFYASIPSISGTTANPGPIGAIARINPLTAKVETLFAVPFCMPAGLALGPDQTFLAGCSVVYDTMGDPWFGADTNSANPSQVIIDTNGVFAFVPGIGSSDEVWFNSGDRHWYTGSQNTPYSPHPVAGTGGGLSTTDQGAGLLGVIDGISQNLDQIVPTFDVPAVKGVHPSGSSHSVAANSTNNFVFVPHPANNAIIGCLTGCIGVYGRKDVDAVAAND